MRDTATAICGYALLCWIPGLFEGLTYSVLALYCRDMQSCIILSLLLSLPQHRTESKSLVAVLLLYAFIDAHIPIIAHSISWYLYDITWHLFFLGFCVLYLFNRYKQFNFKSDKINEDNIMLCFWKPKKGINLLATLIGLPFGGLSIYCGGFIYSYRWGYPTYIKARASESILRKNFVVVDSGVPYTREIIMALDSLVGTPAGRPRIRCIHTIKPVLKMMGKRFAPSNIFDLIPSQYSRRFL
jgi:hypothetical protein